MRLIDADKMLKRIESWNTSDAMDKALYNFTLNRIIEQPTVDANPIVARINSFLTKEEYQCMKEYLQRESQNIVVLPPECELLHPEPVIHCKDCHWHYGTLCRKNNTMPWEDDDFCSHAEREEYETD